MRTILFISFCLISLNCFSQEQDTVINGKHYNTILYYPYFDYMCNDTIRNNYVTAIGNMDSNVKVGDWTYYLSNGGILAQGKYKNGYKNGRWTYMNSRTILIWERSAKAKDFIKFNSITKRPEMIDVVNTKEVSYRMTNGQEERIQPRFCLFL